MSTMPGAQWLMCPCNTTWNSILPPPTCPIHSIESSACRPLVITSITTTITTADPMPDPIAVRALGWLCWLLDHVPVPFYDEHDRLRFGMSGLGCRIGIYAWAERRFGNGEG